MEICEINARMEAYEQAILSLESQWTDDFVERQQGNILRDQLREQAEKWYRKMMKSV